MNWPSPAEYQTDIQDPLNCFLNQELKKSKIVTDKLGLPLVLGSGSFAVVFKADDGQKLWSIRCFSCPVSYQKRHYAHLSDYILKLSIPFLVGFEYLDQGILVSGQLYPIVKMSYVEGVTLDEFIQLNLSNPDYLSQLSESWAEIIRTLKKHSVAHGDLSNTNVLVTTQGDIRLIDYDAMFIPRLKGKNNNELGHPNFQHPKNISSRNYDENMDNFSALVIYASIRALAEEPKLWNEFHNDKNLIFTDIDYRNTKNSKLIQYLKKNGNENIKTLAEKLEDYCNNSTSSIPDLEIIIESLRSKEEKKEPEKPPEPKPSELTVTAISKSGERRSYKSVIEAILNANEDTRIYVRPGHYKENLIINKDIEIIGDGSKEDIIIEGSKSSCIKMTANKAKISNLTLCRHQEKKKYSISISTGQLILKDCIINGGIVIHGSNANSTIQGCKICNAVYGIAVYNGGKGRIVKSEIINNSTAGIGIKDHGRLEISDCQISNNKFGIHIFEKGSSVIENCEIFDNNDAGIKIVTNSSISMYNCKVYKNDYGIIADETSSGIIKDCNLTNNKKSSCKNGFQLQFIGNRTWT